MATNHPVKCPLCSGLGHMAAEELLAILARPNLERKLAQAVLESTESNAEEMVGVSPGEKAEENFERDVHTWNPSQPMWRRSPKE